MAKKVVKYQGISTLEILEGADKYNKWIADQFLRHAKSPVLEFGAGTGNITQFFLEKTPLVVSEVDEALVKKLSRQFPKKKNISFIKLDVSRKPQKSLHGKFNTVFSSNVLEHIEDDLRALKNLKLTLKKNGKLVLLVPAKKIAYGRLDKKLGHFRRYEKKELKNLLESSGYSVEEIYYFNIVGLPAWQIRDIVTKNNDLNSSQVKLFDSIVPFLKRIESLMKPPVGISLIVVAKRKS